MISACVILDRLVFVFLFSNALFFLCVIICFHLLWLSCSKTLDSAYSKQMLEKQLQARACSPRPRSSQPSMSPTRAPKGPSTSSGQPLQKPAQAKRAVRGEMSRGLSLNTTRAPAVIPTSEAVAAICIRTRFSLPPFCFFSRRHLVFNKAGNHLRGFLAVVLRLPAVLKWHNQADMKATRGWWENRKWSAEPSSSIPCCSVLRTVISCYLLLAPAALRAILWEKDDTNTYGGAVTASKAPWKQT